MFESVIMEKSLEDILGQKGLELRKELEELRKKEFNYAVSELKANLCKQNRCSICTLPLPCSHFSSAEEMPLIKPPAKQEFSLSKYTEGLDLSIFDEPTKNFSIRYRSGRQSYITSTSPRQRKIPPANRLKTLEQIEAYREEKLRKEIDQIQQMKVNEEKLLKLKELEKKKRIAKAQKLKDQIEKHREHADAKKNLELQMKEDEARKKKKKEEKLKKRNEELKRKVAEYNEKKKFADIITKQKVDDLQEQVLKKDPATIYLNK